MKMIKKLVLVLMIAMIALTVFAGKSSAMTKDELKDYMLDDKGFAGTNLHAREEDKTKMKRFFSKVDMTDAQASEIKGIIDAAVAFMNGDGATHPNGMSTTENKRKLLGYAEAAADVLGLTVTYDADEERLDIYKDGKLIESLNWGIEGVITASTTSTTTSTGSATTKKQSSKPHLVQTGATNYEYIVIAGVVLVAGITFVIARRNAVKANA